MILLGRAGVKIDPGHEVDIISRVSLKFRSHYGTALVSAILSMWIVSLPNSAALAQDAGDSLPLHGPDTSQAPSSAPSVPAAPTATDASIGSTEMPALRDSAAFSQPGTITGSASLKAFPQLDKNLLVTPGAHPVSVPEPLVSLLGGGGRVIAKIESTNQPRGKFQGILVSVQNNSDRPLLFDGDAASTKVAGSSTACIPLSKLEKLSVLPEQSDSFGKRFVTDLKATTSATVTIGWAQALRDQKQGSGPYVGPNGGRYGLDEQRREDKLRRFGKRVLWPGDSTSGVIYFDQTKTAINDIDLPVSSYYDSADKATMNVHI